MALIVSVEEFADVKHLLIRPPNQNPLPPLPIILPLAEIDFSVSLLQPANSMPFAHPELAVVGLGLGWLRSCAAAIGTGSFVSVFVVVRGLGVYLY